MTKDDVLKMKLDSLHDGTEVQWEGRKATDFAQKLPWKDAFCTVIDKLTLTQASMDAFGENVALIGRSREQQEITTFLRAAIKGAHKFNPDDDDSKHPSMFVAGPPGTGKTVSVCSIIAKLRHEQIRGALPDFDFFSLNGMEMRHPFEAYVRFWEAISGHAKERASPEMAASKLERYFSGQQVKGVPRRQAVVLMLDEIDYLVTRKQTVLYNFFDWPKRSFETADSPRLIVIGISNTVNLPSQMKPSVRSRLGSSRCGFKAYDVQDIVDILTTKIQPDTSSYQVFEKDAIIFAARKIAATTGDIRKALQSCKAAVEAVMQEVEVGTRSDPKAPNDRPMVRIKDIQRVSQEKVGSVMSHAIASAAPLEALVLVSLAALSRHSGRETGGFDIIEVMTKTQAVANASGNSEYTPAPAFHEMLEILGRLAESRLVTLKTEKSSSITFRSSQGGSGGAWPIIGLIVDDCDIISAFRNGPHAQLAEKQLMSAFII
jgi:origin recognition complex subunit 1